MQIHAALHGLVAFNVLVRKNRLTTSYCVVFLIWRRKEKTCPDTIHFLFSIDSNYPTIELHRKESQLPESKSVKRTCTRVKERKSKDTSETWKMPALKSLQGKRPRMLQEERNGQNGAGSCFTPVAFKVYNSTVIGKKTWEQGGYTRA